MSQFSDYLEQAMLNWALRATGFTSPTTTYLGLATQDLTDASGAGEVSGNSYARTAATWNAPTAASPGRKSELGAQVTFPIASGSWGTLTNFGLFDSLTTGNLLYHGTLASSKTVGSGDQFKVNSADASVTVKTAISDYLADRILNMTMRNTNYTAPTTVYLGLFKSDPGPTASGTEVTGGSYARQTSTWAAPVADSGTYKSALNGTVTFPAATADWGAITHFALFDASTAGNLLFYGALDNSKTILTGDQFVSQSSGLNIRLS